jgi:hypothetical protein
VNRTPFELKLGLPVSICSLASFSLEKEYGWYRQACFLLPQAGEWRKRGHTLNKPKIDPTDI